MVSFVKWTLSVLLLFLCLFGDCWITPLDSPATAPALSGWRLTNRALLARQLVLLQKKYMVDLETDESTGIRTPALPISTTLTCPIAGLFAALLTWRVPKRPWISATGESSLDRNQGRGMKQTLHQKSSKHCRRERSLLFCRTNSRITLLINFKATLTPTSALHQVSQIRLITWSGKSCSEIHRFKWARMASADAPLSQWCRRERSTWSAHCAHVCSFFVCLDLNN